MKLSAVITLLALSSSFVIAGCAADSGEEAPQGDLGEDDVTASTVRQAQLNGLRARAEKDFANVRIKVQGNFAFVQARILKRDAQGRAVELSDADLGTSVYAEEIRDGLFDGPNVAAALKKSGTSWSIVSKGSDEAYVVGPTDVAWTAWDTQYGIPSSLIR
jgi:hypothetical protein